MNIISTADLHRLLASAHPPVLLDVRLDEDHAVAHLPGAASACVFKTSFLNDVARLGWNRDQTVVVYGERSGSHESRVAADKLTGAGFTRVTELRAGIQGWLAANHAVEGTRRVETPPALQGVRQVDLIESRVEWTGRNLLNHHFGTVNLKAGRLTFENGWPIGGEFVIDLRSIRCIDLGESSMNGALIAHLQSDDFFDVSRFPETTYRIDKTEPVPGSTPGRPNLRLVGELDLRGQRKPLELLATSGHTADGRFAAQAAFELDRTIWGVVYGSGRLFHRLGMHLVNDLVGIQVRLVA